MLMNKKQGDVKSFFRLKEPLWAIWGDERQYIVSNAQPDVLSHLYLDLCLHCNTLIIETTAKYSAVMYYCVWAMHAVATLL